MEKMEYKNLNESKKEGFLSSEYKGKLIIEAYLYKNKWLSNRRQFTGKFSKYYFVLNLKERTFAYYENSSKEKLKLSYNLLCVFCC